MDIVISIVVSLLVGLVLGTIYGRKLEQDIVGKVLAEYAIAGRLTSAMIVTLHADLTFLRKYIASKV
jgi:FtsH-binding integral membrane protein